MVGWSIGLVIRGGDATYEVFGAGDATNTGNIFRVMPFWVSSVINYVKAASTKGRGLR